MVVMVKFGLKFITLVNMPTNKIFWLILAILVFGLFLRAYQVTSAPPALYWEEVALGYDAFSILETGKDHHGHPWPILAFESFGDWKPSLYFYYLVPFIKILCLTDLAVRSSGVMLGVFMMMGIYFLARQFKFPAAWALFVTAISPWAIHFSRGAWEAHLATVLITWGVAWWWRAVKIGGTWQFLLAVISLGLAPYAYHSARLMVPLLVMILLVVSLWERRADWCNKKIVWQHQALVYPFVAAILVAVLMLPLLVTLLNPNSNLITQRFKETGITSDLEVITTSNQLRDASANSIGSRIFYHRYVIMARTIVENLFSYSSLSFWAVSGDVNLRHGTSFTGLIYHFETVFLIWGVLLMMKRRRTVDWLIWGWLLVALLPATMAKPNPHALRILPALPAVLLIISLGLSSFVKESTHLIQQLGIKYFSKQSVFYQVLQSSTKLALVAIIIGFYLLELVAFFRYYLYIYPVQSQHEWQYGYQQLVSELSADIAAGKPIRFARSLGRPAMYVWFYTNEDPSLVQASATNEEFDQGELITYKKMIFDREVDLGQLTVGEVGVVLASKVDEAALGNFAVTKVVGLDGQPIWYILRK